MNVTVFVKFTFSCFPVNNQKNHQLLSNRFEIPDVNKNETDLFSDCGSCGKNIWAQPNLFVCLRTETPTTSPGSASSAEGGDAGGARSEGGVHYLLGSLRTFGHKFTNSNRFQIHTASLYVTWCCHLLTHSGTTDRGKQTLTQAPMNKVLLWKSQQSEIKSLMWLKNGDRRELTQGTQNWMTTESSLRFE